MPSLSHEALLLLFRNRPELAPELLREALHVPLPEYADVRVESAELTEVAPAQYQADLVILLGKDEQPVLAIVVEVQLQPDARKRYTWPLYATSLRARLECPACVLVVTPSESVAGWARTEIELGPGGRFEPLVLGPVAVPVVRDFARAKREPELAVLSAMAHGKGPDTEDASEIAVVALAAAAELTDERALLYSDLVMLSLSEAARIALEALMSAGKYEYQSDFAKRHRAEGRAEGRAESVLRFLAARGIEVTEDQRTRILACTDLEVLDAWIVRAATITDAEQLFEH